MKRVPIKYLIFLFVFCINYINAQNEEQININNKFFNILNTPDTKTKVDKLTNLFKNASKKKYINYEIIDSAISIGKRITYIEGLGIAYQKKGLTARYNYDYHTAIENHKRALTYLEKTTDTIETIKCLNNIGVAYRKVNIEDKSFSFYFKAYKLAEKINYISSQAIALNGIGNIFIDINKYETALYYFKKALQLEIVSDNLRGIEYDLANIGETNIYIGNYDSAKVYLKKALLYAKKRNKMEKAGPELSLFGLLYQKQKKYQISSNYYKQAVKLFIKNKNYRYLSNALINIGINQINIVNYNKGLMNVRKGLKYAEQVGSKENILLGNNALINYYELTKNFKKAFEIQKITINIKNSILNENSQKNIIGLKIEQESLEKDRQIKQLFKEKKESVNQAKNNHQKLMLSIIIIVMLLILFLLGYFIYRRKTEARLNKMQNELQHYIEQLKINSTLKEKKISLQEQFKDFQLSNREFDVFKLLIQGQTNKEISEKLYISVNTVKSHIKNIYSKLNVKNRMQVIQKINDNTKILK